MIMVRTNIMHNTPVVNLYKAFIHIDDTGSFVIQIHFTSVCLIPDLVQFLSDYYSVFRLILNGYLEFIFVYDLTRDIIAFGNI